MDVVCFDDLDLYGAEMNDPVAELEQDLYHRLIESPGSNLDDPDRGLGIEDMLSGTINPTILKHQIEVEFQKDDRVDKATASVTQTASGEYRVEVSVTPAGSLAVQVSATGVIRLDAP